MPANSAGEAVVARWHVQGPELQSKTLLEGKEICLMAYRGRAYGTQFWGLSMRIGRSQRVCLIYKKW